MRIIYSFIAPLVILMLLGSCKKDYDKSVFEKNPQQRIEEMLKDYKSTLCNAPYGWVGYIYPASGGVGSTFLFKFDSTNRVVENCDLTNETISTPMESSYRVQGMQIPTLVFDTYSYIHLLADPNKYVMGGTAGQGFHSDFEYYFDKTSLNKDTIWMSGARYNTPLVLTKVTDDTRSQVELGFTVDHGSKILTIKNNVQNYLTAAKFTNLTMPDGKQITFTTGGGGILYFYYQNDKDSLVPAANVFSYTATGIHFQDTVKYKGYSFTDLVWNLGTNNSFYIKGREDNQSVNAGIPGDSLPNFPLYELFGRGFTGFYVQPPYLDNSATAISPSFDATYKKIADSLRINYSYTLRYIDFMFNSYYNVFQLHVSIQRGAQVDNANYTYAFTKVPGAGGKTAFQFGNNSKADAGGIVISNAMQPLLNYFKPGKSIIVDWYQSANAGMLGKMTSNDDPTFFFTGTIY